MAAKIANLVRNSPLGRRKTAGYSPVLARSEDPFVRGLSFEVKHIAQIVSPDRVSNEEVQESVTKAIDEAQKKGKPLRKVRFIVRAASLTINDVATKEDTVFPIYLVSYCGTSRDVDTVFFILQKNKTDRIVRAEIFKCENAQKLTAITKTVSKAFNIAYKAWTTKKRQEQKKAGVDSPLLKRATAADAKAAHERGVTEFYTPPVPRKETSPVKPSGHRRSGSFGNEKDGQVAAMIPAMQRVQIQNTATGKQYPVTSTVDEVASPNS